MMILTRMSAVMVLVWRAPIGDYERGALYIGTIDASRHRQWRFHNRHVVSKFIARRRFRAMMAH